VEYGKEADPDHQNSIIDQLNVVITDLSALDSAVADLELQIIGKAELCTDLPADTGASAAVGSSDKASPCDHRHKAVGSEDPLAPSATAAPGTATLASREDHVHPAVSKIIAGSGITLDPASGQGDVTVTAAGGGTTIQTKEFTIPAGDYVGDNTLNLGAFDFATLVLGVRLEIDAEDITPGSGVAVSGGILAVNIADFLYGSTWLQFRPADGRFSTIVKTHYTDEETIYKDESYLVAFEMMATLATPTLRIYSGKLTIYYVE